ncbi:MAG TPA: hypothetical protein VK638_31305, partial [Edaphobacter sp.]|nr:hypothetical protein [Edaphobacter sp.]
GKYPRMSPRSIDLCASYASPQRPPEEQLPKQSLRFTLMQGKPSLLRDECTGTSVTLWTGDIRYKSLAESRV